MIKVLTLILCIFLVQSIIQSCNNTNNTCPMHSSCNFNTNYCICDTSYIGNCSTKSTMIPSNSLTSTLNNTGINLFYVEPISIDHGIEFSIIICQDN